jgi:AraC-like DNA-binding protein
MFWLFARRLFEDGFKLTHAHWLGWSGYALVGLAVILSAQGPFAAYRSALYVLLSLGTMGFAAAAAWVAWRGHGDDLVEQRRQVRPIMMSGAILYVLAVAVAELGMRGAPPSLVLGTFNAGMLAMFAFATLVVFSKGEGAELFAPARPAPISEPSPTRPADVERDPLAARLEALFVEERIYREAELSIAMVAHRLDVPQHRLRILINQTLGHRNFAAFVNGYRLSEAKTALADPEQAEVPIATIALDSGFGSLNAFNRAFKTNAGQTPSAYREQARSGQ